MNTTTATAADFDTLPADEQAAARHHAKGLRAESAAAIRAEADENIAAAIGCNPQLAAIFYRTARVLLATADLLDRRAA